MKIRSAALFVVALVVLSACSAPAPAAPSAPTSVENQHASAVDRVTWACDGSVLIYTWTGYTNSAGAIAVVPGDPRCKA